MTSPNELPPHSPHEKDSCFSNKAAIAKRSYCAFQAGSKKRLFLEFRLRDPEPSESVPYAMLSRICNEWRMGTGITLYFGHTAMVVIIKGENLTELYQAIETQKLKWIAEFNPTEYEQPTDNTAPFIRCINIHTKRPEEIPAGIKRH